MFDPVSIGVATSATRNSRVSSSERVSDLSSRARSDEDTSLSQGPAQEAAGERIGRDPVGLKAKAGDSREGKRHQTDSTEEDAPRPKVKFRSPEDGEPIFEAEGAPAVKRAEPILEEEVSERGPPGDPEALGTQVDVYA